MELTIDQTLQKALSAHHLGDFETAESLYKAILEVHPNYSDVNHNLGMLALEVGKPDKALPFLRAALKENSKHDQYWISYIHALIGANLLAEAKNAVKEASRLVLSTEQVTQIEYKLQKIKLNQKNIKKEKNNKKQAINTWSNKTTKNVAVSPSEQEVNALLAYCNSGKLDLAKTSAELLIKKYPKHAFAWKILGTILQQIGQPQDSLTPLSQALLLAPNDPEAHCNLGVVFKELRRFSEAEASYRQAIALKPDYAAAYYNLGNALRDSGRYSEAEESFRKVLGIAPDYAEACNNLGFVLEKLGRYNEAEACYRQAIGFKFDYVEAFSNLGNALKKLGRYSEAEENHQQAISLNPYYAETHYNLGSLLDESRRYGEAEESYREAITIKSDYAEAYSALGGVLKELGRYGEAEESHQKAVSLQPDNVAILARSELLLPDIYSSVSDIENWRQRYQLGLKAVNTLDYKSISNETQIPAGTFNLAYHNLCNLTLMKERSAFARQSFPEVNYTSSHVLKWKKPIDRKVRIAFCSDFLVGHTIGKLYQGLLKKLDRSAFEITIIHTATSKLDAFSERLDQDADKVIFLGSILSIAHETIAKENLDILFYPDIGMSNETYYLAHARLAPIQMVSWGHPDTTGIDSLDYFLSSSVIEPENADQLYSERLIKLSRLPCYYELMMEPMQPPDTASLNLPTEGTLYGCLQSLFKLHPDFDPILADIVLKDPTSYLIFLEGHSSAWSGLLKDRWAENYPVLNERSIFLPRQPMDKFMALMSKVDVVLDPIHFGSGNTFYESMFYGVPTVTWPGEFMRGRIVAGAYQQMGIVDAPIAEQLCDYADITVQLGRDPEKRGRLKESLRNASKDSLYADISMVQELEQFFLAALDAADKGEKLEINWKPK